MTIVSLYGDTQYGSPLVYGGSTEGSGLLAWGVLIDWDNDGVFDGANEAPRMVAFESLRGRNRMFQKSGGGYEVVPPGKFSFTLTNADGRFDEFNEDSPLYPLVQPGADVKIVVADQATGTVYNVAYGILEAIAPTYHEGKKAVRMTCVETSTYLTKTAARIEITENANVADAVDAILDDVGWAARWGRNIDSSTNTIPYFWANSSLSALSLLREVTEAYQCVFCVDNQGQARMINSATAIAPVLDITQDVILRDVGHLTLHDNYRNVIRVKAHPRVKSSLTTVYQLLGSTLQVADGAGNAIDVWGTYSYNNAPCPVMDLVTPVATTDYLFNTAADGSGTNVTASCSVTFYDFGDTCKFKLTNNSGGDAYCTKLQVRGYAVYETNASDVTYPTDVSTVTNPRELTIDYAWMQSLDVARDFVSVLGIFAALKSPTPTVIFEARPDMQFAVDLFDSVTLTIPALGINGAPYRVSGIDHRTLGENCQAVRTVLYLEPNVFGSVDFWTWDIADFGTDTIFGW